MNLGETHRILIAMYLGSAVIPSGFTLWHS